MAPNLAIISIPAYYFLALIPHTLALSTATQGNLAKLDNRNPRSTTLKEKLKSTLPPDQYAKWERLEACHANGFENLPLYTAAVLAGLLADGVGRAGFAVGQGVSEKTTRFIYSWFANKYTWFRSTAFFVGVGLCFEQFWRAAQVLGD